MRNLDCVVQWIAGSAKIEPDTYAAAAASQIANARTAIDASITSSIKLCASSIEAFNNECAVKIHVTIRLDVACRSEVVSFTLARNAIKRRETAGGGGGGVELAVR